MNARHFTLAAALVFAGTSAFADSPTCTAAPHDTKPLAATLRTLVDAGFTFERAKETKGTCMELKGTDEVGNKVEIYLNPVDGTNVKTEIKKS